MDQKIIDFINANEDLIDDNKWEEVYRKAGGILLGTEFGEFTKILLDVDIHPENYLSELPACFLCAADIFNFKIPNVVTSIDHYAFYDCSSLTNVTIPDNVTYIGMYAFSDCSSLTSVAIGESVTKIDNYAFYNCSLLTSVNIPDSVTYIGSTAFYNCSSLVNITIPDSVTYIGDYTFAYCSSLTSINYQGTREQWKNIKKSSSSFADVPTSVVHCSDGSSYLMAV